MSKPLVSVVIPTYNRYSYLKGSIEVILTIKSDDLEVVICDNTPENGEFIAYLEVFNDKRIKYHHKKEHISMTENCDLGVGFAEGDYVCMIGDDDCVSENIIRAAAYCKENDVEACVFPFPGFNWADMTFEGNNQKQARFQTKASADGSVSLLNGHEELMKSLHSSAGLKATMPKVYHGMVSKACLQRIYDRIGTFFPGPSPDMANAVTVCLEAKKSIYLSDYLIVSGYCYNSATGEGNRGQHFGRIQDKPWLPKDVMEKWDNNVPQIFSGETIIAQSMIQALNTWGCDKKIYKYPYSYLYATFFWHHKDIRYKVLGFYAASPWRLWQFVKGCTERFFDRDKSKASIYNYTNNNVETLMQAKELTEEMTANMIYKPVDN